MILSWRDVGSEHVEAVETIVAVANELGHRPDKIEGSFVRIEAIPATDRDAFLDLCRERYGSQAVPGAA